MSSTIPLVLLVATTWVSSTVAVLPCSDVIIAGLSNHPECYPSGKAPNQQAGSGTGTHIIVPTGEFSDDVTCITAYQVDGQAYVTYHLSNSESTSFTYGQTVKDQYVEETDSDGIIYRLYVIRNEKAVYAYYRCVADGSEGSGSHTVHVAVGCAYVNNTATMETVDTAKKCFNLLGITNYESLAPCDC